MKNLAKIISILLPLVVVTMHCTSETDNTDAVMKSITAFYASIELGDTEARIDLLAEDVILMPNHWTILRGKDEVSESFRKASNAVFKLKDRKMLKFEVSGDVAYTVNSYYYTWHEKGGEAQWHLTKNVHIWRRNKQGEWQLAVDIWNSDVPLSKFYEE